MMNDHPGHRRARDLLGPYLLDALSPEEALEVAEHLLRCPRCREEERELRRAHEYLTDLADVAESPPPDLKPRVVGGPPRRATRWTPFAAAAILSLFALLAAAYAAGIFSPEAGAVSLQPTQLAPEAGGELRVRSAGPNMQADLEVWNLPRLEKGQYYELWFGYEGGRVSAGTFTVDREGRGEVRMSVPRTVGDYERAGITLEKFPEEPRMDRAKVVLTRELKEP